MKTEKYITQEQATTYGHLEAQARMVEQALDGLLVSAVQADIPEHAKLAILKWLERAETFRGLSYFLHPQPEWTGGDSSDPNNFKLRAPHIARA